MLISLRLPFSYRGLAPHKFTPMLGVPQLSRRVAFGNRRIGNFAVTDFAIMICAARLFVS